MEDKIELLRGVDYAISGSIDDVECSLRLPSPLVILTPYKSKCPDSACRSGDVKRIVMTPRRLAESLKGVGHTHVVVENCELMAGFGYSGDLEYLKSKGVSFVLLNARRTSGFVEKVVFLSSNRYFVEARGDERYVVVFALCRIYGEICVISKDVERMRMFSEIFKLNVAVSRGDEDGYRIVAVMDEPVDVKCEKLFYIGEKYSGARTVKLDMGKVGKYVHRIRDVCSMLTPAVVKGKKRLEAGRFRGIEK